jgi:hypothetical protein
VKQRAVTVEGIRFEPWRNGYRGEYNGVALHVEEREGDWIVKRRKQWWRFYVTKTIGGGSTMRAAVRMAKERV